jgi:hypothetical protein
MMTSVPNRPGPHQTRPAHDAGHAKDGLGGLVGAGPSKVGIDGAMRARDVARPTPQELADAERDLVIRHAAARFDNHPLPHGIAPAPAARERTGAPERRQNARPTPHPPRRQASDQPPAEGDGSTPERS